MSQVLVNSFIAAAAAGDPFAAQVVLLMRMEGTDGSTTFVDSSSLATTFFNAGNFTISTTQFKSGASGMKCESTSANQFTYTNASGHELTGDFTIEAWVYFTQAPFNISEMINHYRATLYAYTNLKLNFSPTGGGDEVLGTTAMSLNIWHHVAATRSGSTIRMWLDGVQEGTWTSSATFGVNGQTSRIGALMGRSTTPGYLDLLRITKADRYGTSSFTPPGDY